MKNIYKPAVACCFIVFTILFCCFPGTINAQEIMRTNLYVVDANSATLVDGNLTNYNNSYNNAVDIEDAWKMNNPGINFSIFREGFDLVVERRKIIGSNDTTFFRMWNMPQYNYRIRFILKNLNHPGLKAVFKDNYLDTETNIGLNDTTNYDFIVNANPASASQMRFQLIFRAAIFSPVELSFAGIEAKHNGKDVMVEWKVENEVSMKSYIVEQADDGSNFHEIQKIVPYNSALPKTYNYIDAGAAGTVNFYRIKAQSISGRIQYSPVAKIDPDISKQGISVFPNPVSNKIVQLQFNNQPAGKYNFVLLSNNGNQLQLPPIQLYGGQSVQSVYLPQNLASGVYRLLLTRPDELRIVKTIQVL